MHSAVTIRAEMNIATFKLSSLISLDRAKRMMGRSRWLMANFLNPSWFSRQRQLYRHIRGDRLTGDNASTMAQANSAEE